MIAKNIKILITRDKEFQIAGAMMLNALDWKLILAALVANVTSRSLSFESSFHVGLCL